MDTRTLARSLAALALLPAAVLCQEDAAAKPDSRPKASHPLDRDATGIHWVHPFHNALAKAKKEGRLLLFLPLAGGTNLKGDW